MWESNNVGLLGPKSLNLAKLEEEGHRGGKNTMLCFKIDL